MAFTIFDSLQSRILPTITDLVEKSSELVSWVSPIILAGVTLTLMIYGFEVIRGAGGHQYFLDALAKVARPFLVLNIALIGGAYSSTVVGFFKELRTDLAAVFGAKGDNSYIALDSAVSDGLDALANLVPFANQQISVMNGNFQGVLIYACMAVIGFGLLFYAVVAAINLLMIDASLALIFGLGPLFVGCFAFQSTARFFDSWLSAVLKYTITAALISVVIGLSNSLIQKFAKGLLGVTETSDFIGVAATSFATAGILVFLILRAAQVAGDLVGGVGISLAGPAAVMRSVAPAASGAGRGGAFAGGAVMGAAGNAMRGAGAAAGRTTLGARVLQATAGMRHSASQAAERAATTAKGFGHAMSGHNPMTGRSGYGMGNAFNMGRQSTAHVQAGTGTITGAPQPSSGPASAGASPNQGASVANSSASRPSRGGASRPVPSRGNSRRKK
ncbi:type IV secretion system protein [Delftia sp. GW456-R20]|uniref:type IV secretion system protein n=1 Tax=Delftia sp. GW456-R20 TaxID=1827145 RepID=UPI0009ED495D|nr:type IV secretion system protein [Delftia sp. GW456-R20]